MTQDDRRAGPFRSGDPVEVNITGLSPVTITEVLVEGTEDEDWHPAEIVEVLPGDMYSVHVMPLVGAIEVPPVHRSRLRPR